MSACANFGIRASHYYVPKKVIPIDKKIQEQYNIPDNVVRNLGVEQILKADGETQMDMAYKVASELLEKANMTINDIDMLLYSTAIPQRLAWPAGIALSHMLGKGQMVSFDIFQVCNSCIVAIDLASKYFACDESIKNIMYVTADTDNHIYAPGFGFKSDGAAGIIFSRESLEVSVQSVAFCGDGYYNDWAYATGSIDNPKLGGKLVDDPSEELQNQRSMEIIQCFLTNTEKLMKITTEKSGVALSDVDLFICNNLSKSLPLFLSQRFNLDYRKIFADNVPKGYHVGASDIIINLTDVAQDKALSSGKLACLISFGGGFNYGSAILKFNER